MTTAIASLGLEVDRLERKELDRAASIYSSPYLIPDGRLENTAAEVLLQLPHFLEKPPALYRVDPQLYLSVGIGSPA